MKNGMSTFKRNSVLWHNNGWMAGWMNEWMDEWMNDRYVNLQAKFCFLTQHQWMNGWMNELINERYINLQAKFRSLTQHQLMNGWMNEWTVYQPPSEISFSGTTPLKVPLRVFPLNSTLLLTQHHARYRWVCFLWTVHYYWHNTTRGTGESVSSEQCNTTDTTPREVPVSVFPLNSTILVTQHHARYRYVCFLWTVQY